MLYKHGGFALQSQEFVCRLSMTRDWSLLLLAVKPVWRQITQQCPCTPLEWIISCNVEGWGIGGWKYIFFDTLKRLCFIRNDLVWRSDNRCHTTLLSPVELFWVHRYLLLSVLDAPTLLFIEAMAIKTTPGLPHLYQHRIIKLDPSPDWSIF